MMDVRTFETLAEHLTGTPVKDSPSDRAFLAAALQDDMRCVDCSQFNELLLIVNKDRLEPPFFSFFFGGESCQIGEIQLGVLRFQKYAMLCYGNFIFAYRKLSHIKTKEGLLRELGDYAATPRDLKVSFHARQAAVLRIETIPREDSYLLGYLSAGEIVAEEARGTRLLQLLDDTRPSTWKNLGAAIAAGVSDSGQATELSRLAGRLRLRAGRAKKPILIRDGLANDLPELKRQSAKVDVVQSAGEKNADVYLTWDHMDIYFATSMRKRWEYEDLHDFVSKVMQRPELRSLKIRYFDPTQSFNKNRIDKGLIEALMLKRAKCTVYSVQDTDTLGKDSELAATLAQGKPVVAYAPRIDVEKRTRS